MVNRRRFIQLASGLLVPAAHAQFAPGRAFAFRTRPTAGTSYDFEENFENTGYENSWTEAGTGTIDEDYSTSGLGLEGSQCLRLAASAQAPRATSANWTALPDMWFYLLLRPLTLPSATMMLLTLQASTTECLRIRLDPAGTLKVRAGGGTENTTVAALPAGTTHHIWCRYTKGTGSNAFGLVAFSTDGIRPTSGNQYRDTTNGTATSDCTNVRFGVTSSGTFDLAIDKIRVSSSTIGNNPS
jgi:hypothetical protein